MTTDTEALVRRAYHLAEGDVPDVQGFTDLFTEDGVFNGIGGADITPAVPHVFQTFHPILDEAAAALDRVGQLLSAHLASAERVTA